MFKVKIRAMTPSDAETVFAIAQESGLEFWKKNDYEDAARQSDIIAAIAECEEKTLGFIVSRLIMYNDSDLSVSEIGLISEIKLRNSDTRKKKISENLENADNSEFKEKSEIDAEIYNIAVRKDFSGRGIGGKLLEHLCGEILSHGTAADIWLEVRESNVSAINFYRRRGFVINGVRKAFYGNPTENAFVMKMELSASENPKC